MLASHQTIVLYSQHDISDAAGSQLLLTGQYIQMHRGSYSTMVCCTDTLRQKHVRSAFSLYAFLSQSNWS